MKLLKKLLIVLAVLIMIQLTISINISLAYSSSVEFIVDFSESMNDKIGDKSKIEIAREILVNILDEIRKPVNAGLTFYGHRDRDKCDDIELVVASEGIDRETMKKKLMNTEPKGKAPIALALKMTAERLKDIRNSMTIVLITDGKMNCEGDLIKTAREIKEKYDYSIVFHVIGLNPGREDRMRLLRVASVGYGKYHTVKNKDNIKEVIKSITESLNNPEIHNPKVVNSDDMVLIPAGEFIMGSDLSIGNPNERPAHSVYLDAFYIDKYEVTQKRYKEVMGKNPSFWIGSDLPVECVTWFEAKEYCEKVGKRLPAEAEWEKAAKGGRNDIWAGTSKVENLAEYAWCDDTNAHGKTHPVGLKKPNGYGIYDMSGNVQEWVADSFISGYYKISPKDNPKGPDKGVFKILRGGDWDHHKYEIRTSNRYVKTGDVKYGDNGFRCAKSAE